MTLEQAYAILGLKPLDQFIKYQMDSNMNGIPPVDKALYSGQISFQHRSIGATTWMLVSAVLQMEKSDVLIVAHTNKWQRKLQNRMEEIVKGLHFPAGWERREGKTVLAARGHFAFFSTNRANANGDVRVVGSASTRGMPFEDIQWKFRAIRRSEGPFGMVKEIRYQDGEWDNTPSKYLAFAKDDEFLFDLTREGAIDLVKAHPEIKTRGWGLPIDKEPPERFDHHVSKPDGQVAASTSAYKAAKAAKAALGGSQG